MNPVRRTCSAGVLTLAIVAASGAAPALALTDSVSGSGMLAAPTSLSPDDSTVRKDVTLDWAPVTGATTYKVEVGRDASWSDTPVFAGTAVVSQLVLPVSLPHGSYVWRVAALKGGVLGHWSSETSDPEFTRGWSDAPTTIAPTLPVGGRPEFSWTPVDSASAYEVQVTDSPFLQDAGIQEAAPGHVDTCFTARTRVTFFTEHAQNGESNTGPCFSTLLGTGDTRYWRVRALDRYTGEAGAYSTDPAAHGISDAPPSGAPDASIASDCKGDTGGGCEPAAPSEYSSWSTPVTFTSTSAAPSGSYDPATSVTVHALESDPDALCAPNTPSAGITTCTDFPTVAWDAASGATRYRLTVALDAAMSNVQRILDTAGLQWTPTDSWAEAGPSKGYFLTIQACDGSQCGNAGTPVAFRKVSPRSLITSSAPAVTGEFTLAWQSYADALAAASSQAETQGAYAYRLQVATSAHPSFDVLVDEQELDATTYMPQVAYGDGTFVWRVQAIDSANHKLPWSASQTFTRDVTAPVLVSVTPSSRVEVREPLKLVFSEAVTGVSASSVSLSPATSATVTVTGTKTATLTPTASLIPGATYSVVVGSAVEDLSGNVANPTGPTFTVTLKVDNTSKAFTYGGSWKLLTSSNAVGGSYHSSLPTSTSKTTATTKFAGTGVAVLSCLGPAKGYLDVYVDGVKKSRVNLYRSYTGCGVQVATISGLTRTTHTLKLVGIGAHTSASTGNAVAVDFVTVTP